MPDNRAASNVLGTIGTVCWSAQIIPQIWKSWREHSTEGLSGPLMLIWATSAMFLGVYNIVNDINIPLIVQPQSFGFLAAASWVQCLHYTGRRSARQCLLILLAYTLLFAGFEVGMVYAVRALQAQNPKGGDAFAQFFGVMSAVLIAIGLFPQYWEIYRLGEVIGISLIFMAVDISGGVFSCLSLIFRKHFDGFAASSYIVVIAMDGIVVLCALILNPRAQRRKARLVEGTTSTAIIASGLEDVSEGATTTVAPSSSSMMFSLSKKEDQEDLAAKKETTRPASVNNAQAFDLDLERGAFARTSEDQTGHGEGRGGREDFRNDHAFENRADPSVEGTSHR